MVGVSIISGGSIRPSRFVKNSTAADDAVLEADAGERTLGISGEGTKAAPQTGSDEDHAEAGDMCTVFLPGRTCLLEIGSGGVARGGMLTPDADGKGVAQTTDKGWYGARAMSTAIEGDKIKVLVEHGYYAA